MLVPDRISVPVPACVSEPLPEITPVRVSVVPVDGAKVAAPFKDTVRVDENVPVVASVPVVNEIWVPAPRLASADT